ncbi:uncharacterized protein LOC111026081 [Momordica charantia]|uniref:Uncharacterized protein LOC111026081 n=1 Tax=Momordica charantia TaxID=3673 RepID=A0A6J1E388_MOMCH|nr:uncharacterized protein LOC111026081 [Momordica charantia]
MLDQEKTCNLLQSREAVEKNRGVVGLKPTRAPLEPQLEGTSSEPQSTWSYVNGSAQIGDGFDSSLFGGMFYHDQPQLKFKLHQHVFTNMSKLQEFNRENWVSL